MKCLVMFALAAMLALPATGQTVTSTSPAKSIGVFAYPKNNQGADQQLKDETDCYASAQKDSGVDPTASAASRAQP